MKTYFVNVYVEPDGTQLFGNPWPRRSEFAKHSYVQAKPAYRLKVTMK